MAHQETSLTNHLYFPDGYKPNNLKSWIKRPRANDKVRNVKLRALRSRFDPSSVHNSIFSVEVGVRSQNCSSTIYLDIIVHAAVYTF